MSTWQIGTAEAVAVEVESPPGSGAFRTEHRLGLVALERGSGSRLSRAWLTLRPDSHEDPDVWRLATPFGRRVRIVRDDSGGRVCAFEGFFSARRARWRGRRVVMGMEATGLLGLVAGQRRALVAGRYMPRSTSAGATPAVARVAALPCIFNSGGRRNRAAARLPVSVEGYGIDVPLFADDGAEGAQEWTLRDVLLYLLVFHWPAEVGLSRLSVVQMLGASSAGADEVLRAAVGRCPRDLVLEGTNVVEALVLTAAAAGLGLCETYENGGGAALRLWSPATTPVRHVYLARGGRDASGGPRYPTAGRSAARIARDNNTHRGAVEWRFGGRRGVVVVGGAPHYEVTVPLVPGWVVEPGLDDVEPADREAARSVVVTPAREFALGEAVAADPWFRRYDRRGAEFGAHADVGRRWVLNEAGQYGGEAFERYAPFDVYRPFSFVGHVPREAGAERWVARPRPLTASRAAENRAGGRGVLVEVSYDSGNSWEALEAGYEVLADEAGIWLAVTNPAAVAPAGRSAEEDNWWFALMDQRLRVRVTAAVPGDAVVVGRGAGGARGEAGGIWDVVYEPERFGAMASPAEVSREICAATASAAETAERLASAAVRGQTRGRIVVPGFDVSYEIGDRVAGLAGRDWDFGSADADGQDLPVIVAKRYRRRGGMWETVLVFGTVEAW